MWAKESKSRARLAEVSSRAFTAILGDFAVDELGKPYGRGVLSAAASAATRAAVLHDQVVGGGERNRLYRQALLDALSALDRIEAIANFAYKNNEGLAFRRATQDVLNRLPMAVGANGRGSPGKAVQRAAAEAAAQVWAEAEDRPIPRAGIKEADHDLAKLLSALSIDLFGAAGRLSAAYLRPLSR